MEIRHIGIGRAFCDGRKRAMLRTDLGADRYRRLGLKERFTGEAPYKICRACIKRAGDWKWRLKNRKIA
jgi:hypothetical protein